MVGPTVKQQTKPGIPTRSRLAVILQSFVQFCLPIAKFNNVFPDNSMVHVDVEFFVYPVPVLVNAPKRDQVPASF